MRNTINEMPLKVADGNIFQFDQWSEKIMKKAAENLSAVQSIDWRLLDNSTVSVDAASLHNYFNECEALQFSRAQLVDVETQHFKNHGATLRELENWRLSYSH
ncbi:MAG: hypothetical protein KTR20_12890 [Cellvibrionaceae bacterium]|nr:hypothetical protein [Cellvibrionaceae bacterium]